MFENREEAGKLLAEKLGQFKNDKNVIVLGIPRGGVVVAKIVSQELNLPLDIVVVRKIGAPGNLELAIGAVGSGGIAYWDEDLCRRLGINKKQRSKLKNQKLNEVRDREKIFRQVRKPPNVQGKTVIVVDDGVATGATVMAGALFLQKTKVGASILAVPVIAKDTLSKVKEYFSDVVYLDAPIEFYAVGQFYKEFPQVEDNEVVRILNLL